MSAGTAEPLLVVAGAVSVDTIRDTAQLGGAAYAARAAVAAGYRAAIVGPVGATIEASVRTRLSAEGVDTTGLIPVPGNGRQSAWTSRRKSSRSRRSSLTRESPRPIRHVSAWSSLSRRLAFCSGILRISPASCSKIESPTACRARPAGLRLEWSDGPDPRSGLGIGQLVNGGEQTDVRTPGEAVSHLRALGTRAVVLKFGPGGAMACPEGQQWLRIPALLTRYDHSAGAGDAFDAVFLATLATAPLPPPRRLPYLESRCRPTKSVAHAASRMRSVLRGPGGEARRTSGGCAGRIDPATGAGASRLCSPAEPRLQVLPD